MDADEAKYGCKSFIEKDEEKVDNTGLEIFKDKGDDKLPCVLSALRKLNPPRPSIANSIQCSPFDKKENNEKKPKECRDNFTYYAVKIKNLKRFIDNVRGSTLGSIFEKKLATTKKEFKETYKDYRNELTPFEINLYNCVIHEGEFVLENEKDEIELQEKFKNEEWDGNIYRYIFN